MISAQLLNSTAQLNDWEVESSVTFVPGDNLRVVLQILSSDLGIRYIPPVAAALSLTFTNIDGTLLTKTATLLSADDRSIWYVDLSQSETNNLGGSNVVVKLDANGDGTVIYSTALYNAVIRQTLSGECC